MTSRLKCIGGVLGACGVVFGLMFSAQRARTESDYTALLHSLRGTNIARVVIANKSGAVLSSISEPVALDAFARAVNGVETYSPNHPHYTKSFYVELYLVDNRKCEFEFQIMQPSDHMTYVYFIRRSGALTAYYGNCKSAALFDWMKEQTPN